MYKIFMDNGSIYELQVSENSLNKLIYNYQRLPMGQEVEILKNSFVELPNSNIRINPSHISSIEKL